MNELNFELWAGTGLVVLAAVVCIWMLSLKYSDFSLIDRFWGLLFALMCSYSLIYLPGELSTKSLILMGMIGIWGVRLSWHIHSRNRGGQEDPRYTKFRNKYSPESFWWKSLFVIFLFQGTAALIVAFPITATASQILQANTQLHLTHYVALCLWTIGFLFEITADRQLKQFKNDPANKGKICTTGVWKLSRHPNYFGDALAWWGVGLFAVAGGAGLWVFVGPALMTTLLWKVTGASLLEKTMMKRPGYAQYCQSTASFVPGTKWVERLIYGESR